MRVRHGPLVMSLPWVARPGEGEDTSGGEGVPPARGGVIPTLVSRD